MTTKELILDRLARAPYALACHELQIMGVSENGAATRLSELQREGKVIGVRRSGKPFKEWSITRAPIIKFEDNGQACFI